jgi:hypothetical protein
VVSNKKVKMMDKYEYSIIILLGVITILNIAALGFMYHENMEVLGYIKYQLDFANKTEEFKGAYYDTELAGIYFADKYLCVWTEGKTSEEINNTFCHESCHDFVYKEYEHFCTENDFYELG